MTREEAINIMSQMIKDEEGFLSDNTVEAHKMAIKALEQEPCEDCISRETARRIVDSGRTRKHMIDMILATPPVIPQPKIGRWILQRIFPTKLYDEHLNEYECSECGRRIRCTESQLVNYPYCHCGAEMEG